MFAKIKMWFYVAIGLIVSILVGMLKYMSKKCEKAENEAKSHKMNAKKAKEAVEQMNRNKDMMNEVNLNIENINISSRDDIDSRLSKYKRD